MDRFDAEIALIQGSMGKCTKTKFARIKRGCKVLEFNEDETKEMIEYFDYGFFAERLAAEKAKEVSNA